MNHVDSVAACSGAKGKIEFIRDEHETAIREVVLARSGTVWHGVRNATYDEARDATWGATWDATFMATLDATGNKRRNYLRI